MSDEPAIIVRPLVSSLGGPVAEVVVPGPQGPARTDYQIGGSMPTDPNVLIWYKTD